MKVKVGIVQSDVSGDVSLDLLNMRESVRACKSKGAQIVVLSEMFCCPYQAGAFSKYAEVKGGRIYCALQDAAKESGVILVGGSMPLREGDRIYNACFVFDGKGKELCEYRKIHLFDINIKDGVRFCESDELSAGDSVAVFDTEFGRFGVSICYDIRFFELADIMRRLGCVAIFVPAAFNTITGPLHWETLFRGRATDNQLFTVGVSPSRSVKAVYKAYGHSIAVSPWGRVLMELNEMPQTETVELDLDEIEAVRSQLPISRHKRYSVYKKYNDSI